MGGYERELGNPHPTTHSQAASKFKVELEITTDGLTATAREIEEAMYAHLEGQCVKTDGGDSGLLTIDSVDVEVSE